MNPASSVIASQPVGTHLRRNAFTILVFTKHESIFVVRPPSKKLWFATRKSAD